MDSSNDPLKPTSVTDAVYYHNDVYGSRILVNILQSYLHGRVLEVGAGAGFITTELAAHSNVVVAVEPTPELHEELSNRTAQLANVAVVRGTLRDYIQNKQSSSHSLPSRFDAIVYINVLEHIKDDIEELSLAKELLEPGGYVLIVVPAHQWLYARVDRLTGHFRRYSKRALGDVVSSSGLHLRDIKYFDSVGLLPYLMMYKLLQSTATSGTNAKVYSRIIMPISNMVFRFTRGRLIGKNLIAIAGASAIE